MGKRAHFLPRFTHRATNHGGEALPFAQTFPAAWNQKLADPINMWKKSMAGGGSGLWGRGAAKMGLSGFEIRIEMKTNGDVSGSCSPETNPGGGDEYKPLKLHPGQRGRSSARENTNRPLGGRQPFPRAPEKNKNRPELKKNGFSTKLIRARFFLPPAGVSQAFSLAGNLPL